jgi:hypothetical protein
MTRATSETPETPAVRDRFPRSGRAPLFAPVRARRSLFARLAAVFEVFRQVHRSMRERLGVWSLPLVFLLLVLGVALILIAFVQPLAPFLYPLF